MNIGFLIGTLHGGGAERVMSTIASKFAEEGHKTILITFYKRDDEYTLSDKVKRYNLRDKYYEKHNIFTFQKTQNQLRRICKKENIDVLISFMIGANNHNIILSKTLNMKSIISVRNDPSRTYIDPISKFIGKYIYPLADGCIFQTEDAKKWFSNKLKKKSTIICNPVNPIFYTTTRNCETYRIVATGRLEEQKNHSLLIRAFKDVIGNIPEAKLYIYGEGSLKNQLLKQISSLNLQESVFLMGKTANIAGELSKADIFVLSSDYEGMPNCLMEAMAMGVPVISTDCPCGGPRELLKKQENGVLVPVNDASEMSKAIINLLNDEKKKKMIGLNAQLYAENFKDYPIYINWVKYINEVLER